MGSAGQIDAVLEVLQKIHLRLDVLSASQGSIERSIRNVFKGADGIVEFAPAQTSCASVTPPSGEVSKEQVSVRNNADMESVELGGPRMAAAERHVDDCEVLVPGCFPSQPLPNTTIEISQLPSARNATELPPKELRKSDSENCISSWGSSSIQPLPHAISDVLEATLIRETTESQPKEPHTSEAESCISSRGDYEEKSETLVVRRLRAKLGYKAPRCLVTAEELIGAAEAVTFKHMELEDVRALVQTLRGDIQDDRPTKKTWNMSGNFNHQVTGISFQRLVRVFLLDEDELDEQVYMDTKMKCLFILIRDSLLSSDVNCLIAELMSVRVDDLAALPERPSIIDFAEPLVGCVIFLNGVVIGLQADPTLAENAGIICLDVLFTLFFVVEILMKVKIYGCIHYFAGAERRWNIFDSVVVVLAVLDSSMYLIPIKKAITSQWTLVRLVRLTRLTRLIRIFRLRFMDELTLMVKGLIVGLRTLFWALVLLTLMVYVVAVFLTVVIGNADASENGSYEDARKSSFSTVPKSMFTTFRCLLVVDCSTSGGSQLLPVMYDEYGLIFAIGYVLCFVLVGIGLTNLITAIYIENTLNQAKTEEIRHKAMRNRESIRVARQMKQLVLKLSAKQKAWQTRGDSFMGSKVDVTGTVSHLEIEDLAQIADSEFTITREVFFYGIQDPAVQTLMDELDIPPQRASLFDVFDANGNGEIHPTELVNGLLRVRGDTRRSDIVAPLLAVRALQQDFAKFEAAVLENQKRIFTQCSDNFRAIRRHALNSAVS